MFFFPSRIIEQNGGKPPLTYKQFLKVLSTFKLPPQPAPKLGLRLIGHGESPVTDDHDERWAIPSLFELGKLVI